MVNIDTTFRPHYFMGWDIYFAWCRARLAMSNRNYDYVGDKAKADKISHKPQLEQRREWEHSEEGKGKDCYRANRPVYTPVEKRPDECHSCDNNKWYSKSIITRDKDSKKVIVRDGKTVK